jgi:dTDP-glucose pyrophosphorylase
MEYVISDGLRHAIGKVVCVIRKGQLAAAEEVLSGAWEHLPVEFIFQSGEDGPNGVPIPSAIAHSPGTAHAVFAARDAIGGPFVVANGDDLYGPAAWDALLDAVGAGCERPTNGGHLPARSDA